MGLLVIVSLFVGCASGPHFSYDNYVIHDEDQDGVEDNQDQCHGTRLGCKVDDFGCPMDPDSDGVYSGIDRCEKTPKGCPVDAYGCPLDTDEDGVWDYYDHCTKTLSGCEVETDINSDWCGCGLDSDNDGICDGWRDKCPGTPKGLQVDDYGCPRAYKIEKELVLIGVIFEYGQSDLDAQDKNELDKVAESLNAIPHVRIAISGHGTADEDKEVSRSRAWKVYKYFQTKGIDAERMIYMGLGSKYQKFSKAKENRRVELHRLN